MTQWISLGGWVMIPLLGMLFFACFILIERTWFLMTQGFDIQLLGQKDPPQVVKDLALLVQEKVSEEAFDKSSQTLGQAWILELERRSAWLDFIITAAPLLGLLGTITGMMKSFQVMGVVQSSTTHIQITGGVAESLIATATGLGVALIALAGHFFLKSRRHALEQAFEIWLLYFQRKRRHFHS